MSSLEPFPFEASASLESTKLEISSSESTSSDGSLPAKVLKLDISSPESRSSEGTPLKGKALMHAVGIKTDSKMLTDHSSVTLDCESCYCESCSCNSPDCDDYLSHPEIVAYGNALATSGGFDVPLVSEELDGDGMIVPLIPLTEAHRQYVKPFCIAAIDHFNQNEHKNYKFVNLVKANKQSACGIQYYLTFEAHNPEDGTNQTLQAVVLDGIPDEDGETDVTVFYCKRKAEFSIAGYTWNYSGI